MYLLMGVGAEVSVCDGWAGHAEVTEPTPPAATEASAMLEEGTSRVHRKRKRVKAEGVPPQMFDCKSGCLVLKIVIRKGAL